MDVGSELLEIAAFHAAGGSVHVEVSFQRAQVDFIATCGVKRKGQGGERKATGHGKTLEAAVTDLRNNLPHVTNILSGDG